MLLGTTDPASSIATLDTLGTEPETTLETEFYVLEIDSDTTLGTEFPWIITLDTLGTSWSTVVAARDHAHQLMLS